MTDLANLLIRLLGYDGPDKITVVVGLALFAAMSIKKPWQVRVVLTACCALVLLLTGAVLLFGL